MAGATAVNPSSVGALRLEGLEPGSGGKMVSLADLHVGGPEPAFKDPQTQQVREHCRTCFGTFKLQKAVRDLTFLSL